jgi:hypothetical protein
MKQRDLFDDRRTDEIDIVTALVDLITAGHNAE